MEEPADYRQAEEAEMLQWLDEQDAKRRMRGMEALEEMRKGLDEPDDDFLAVTKNYRAGDPVGYGPTPGAAIADLKEKQ